MSRVIYKCLESKQTDSKSCTWMTFNTDRTKPMCNNKSTKDMAIVKKSRETSQVQTANEYRQQIYAYE